MSQAPQPPPAGPPGGPSGPPGGPSGPTEPPTGGEPPTEPGGSRNLWTVLGVGAGVIVLAVVLFVLLRPDDDENAADTTPAVQVSTTVETTTEATTEVTTTVQTTTEQTTTTTPAEEVQRVPIEVVNGQPVGGVQQVDIEQGTQVLLVVHADVEDEIHLHGYDLSADVAPDQPARIRFRADLAGEFEVELEDRGVQIANLIVSP